MCSRPLVTEGVTCRRTILVLRTPPHKPHRPVMWRRQMRDVMDWHLLPGVTEEARTDSLPSADSNVKKIGGSNFAVTASDGDVGVAAFKNIHHPDEDTMYSSAASSNGYFFFDTGVRARGSSFCPCRAQRNMPV